MAAGVAATSAGDGSVPPSNADTPGGASAVVSGDEATGAAFTQSAAEAGQFRPDGSWVAPTELLWRKWLFWGTIPVVTLVLLIGAWSIFAPDDDGPSTPGTAAEAQDESLDETDVARDETRPTPLPDAIDPRWLPGQAAMLFRVRPADFVALPNSAGVVEQVNPVWSVTGQSVLQSLGLKPQDVERFTFVSSDLAAWPNRGVAVVELSDAYNVAAVHKLGKPTGKRLAGNACRSVAKATWNHPFALVDRRTIVTADTTLLAELDRLAGQDTKQTERGTPTFQRLVQLHLAKADFTLLVDLDEARRAMWPLPDGLLDVWPELSAPWRTIWDSPAGLGCWLHHTDHLRSEVALVCRSATVVEQLESAVNTLLATAKQSLSDQLESLPQRVTDAELSAATAQQYELLVKEGLAASRSAQCDVADGVVWIRTGWGQGPSVLATATAGSRTTMHENWLAAARKADRAMMLRLLSGLSGRMAAEGSFPSAAAGGTLLAPETRLSWIASMLPYYGKSDWHRDLNFSYSWNSAKNRQVTRRMLAEVVNPAWGPSNDASGSPVTHYVGVAGIGPDAGRLKADDARAGVFGYGRTTRLEDIRDGASNTIAMLGVTKDLGAWGSGGSATVRALTQHPYVNGPDGFGSGQPDGMFAGMADGSARFVSKDIDPSVLEQLATIRGGEGTTVAALSPNDNVAPPDAAPAEPDKPAQTPDPAVDPPADPPVQPPRQPAGPPIDVEARLADRIPEIDLPDVPLGHAIGLVSAISTLPVTFDPDALMQQSVSLTDPVSLERKQATVAEILDAIAKSVGLAVVVEQGQVLITTPPDQHQALRQGPYSVDDLIGPTAGSATELADMVQRLVAPDSWQKSGGRGTIKPSGKVLVVVQTADVHYQILIFCQKLRSARGLPLRGSFSPELFSLVPRHDRAAEMLARPVTADFHEPTALVEILAFLGSQTDSILLIDRLALSRAGLSDRVQASASPKAQPLGAALTAALEPLDLACRVIDAQMLQITTRQAVESRCELEFYPVANALDRGETVPTLIERIKGRVGGSTWQDVGGPGVLHYDEPSRHLIVLQSQTAQQAIQKLLGEKP